MEIMAHICQYIEEVFQDIQMDYKLFVLNIFSFLYFVVFDNQPGNHKPTMETRNLYLPCLCACFKMVQEVV